MWGWVEPVLQYGSGPAIAAGALLWQQRRVDKREERLKLIDERERLKDREHERSLADEARAHSLQELNATLAHERDLRDDARKAELANAWRDERRRVYTDLLEFTEKVDQALVRAIFGQEWNDDGTFVQDPSVERAIAYGAFDRHLANIQLFGSMKAVVAARKIAKNAESSANEAFYSCKNPLDEDWSRESAINANRSFDEACEEFLAAVRRDLGLET